MRSEAAEYLKNSLTLVLLTLLLGASATFAQIDLTPLDNSKPIEPPPPRRVIIDPGVPEKNNPETAEEFYQMAEWAYSHRYYRFGIVNLDKAITLKPNFAEAYQMRGTLQFNLLQYQDAINDSTTAIEIAPDSANAYHTRGLCRYKLRDYEGALTDLNRHIDLWASKNRTMVNAIEIRGRLKYILGDLDGAIEDFDRAYIPEKFTSPRFYRALTYLKKGDELRAISDLVSLADYFEEIRKKSTFVSPKTYVDKDPERRQFPYGENPLVTAQVKDSDVKFITNAPLVGRVDGKSLCSVHTDGQPQNEDSFLPDSWFYPNKHRPASSPVLTSEVIYFMLGDLYEKNGEIPNAVKAFTASIVAGRANSETSHCRRGSLMLSSGEFVQAASDLSWAIRGWQKRAALYLERGIAIYLLGHGEIAQKDFDKFLSLNPDGKAELDSRISAARKLREEILGRRTQN